MLKKTSELSSDVCTYPAEGVVMATRWERECHEVSLFQGWSALRVRQDTADLIFPTERVLNHLSRPQGLLKSDVPETVSPFEPKVQVKK